MAKPELTPMLRHYLEVKAEHPDAVLFYRMGDFFELFFEDAVEAAPILEVALTARQKGSPNEAPMCGVPHHAVESYIGKLIAAGYRVAICDQVEDPAEAKGLVRREVTRIVTPGTLSDPLLLDGAETSLLVALEWRDGAGAGAFLEVSTADFVLSRWGSLDEAVEELRLREPRELLVASDPPEEIATWAERRGVCVSRLDEGRRVSPADARRLVEEQLGSGTLRGYGLEPGESAVVAAAHALSYARETQGVDLDHIRDLRVRERRDGMILDATTLANLEVFRNAGDGSRRGTLRSVVDRTRTAAGRRRLDAWLREPLTDRERIHDRLDAVQALLEAPAERRQLGEAFGGVGDVERMLARASLGTLTPREAGTLRETLRRAPAILAAIDGSRARLLAKIASIDPGAELLARLEVVLEEEPPASMKNGGVIAAGVDDELDSCRSLAQDSKRHVLSLEERERERTGVPSLKVRYNRVHGYYIEITKANLGRVPEDYTRRQTLVNSERFVTPEIKELEERILTAESRQIELEEQHFRELLREIASHREVLATLGTELSRLDVLTGFAEAAERDRYTRPRIDEPGGPIEIRDGRHPVVERLGSEPFVPNDVELGDEQGRIVVLTGPNMGGKSTYLRQVALTVLLAQLGCFVPAAEASIGVVDRIFTRVGASDDLTRGESTFMVEMIETANILRYATSRSLVVLDEVGRGTATFDGLALAWAVVEYLESDCGAKTLFATHYHELTELAALLPGVVNRTMLVKEWEERIVFLRRVVPGQADKSYGIQVARLAGLPADVLSRARELLENLESQEFDVRGRPRIARGEGAAPARGGADQLDLFAPPDDMVISILRELDLDQLSPLAALNLLTSLRARLDGAD